MPPPGEANLTLQLTPKQVPQGLTDGREGQQKGIKGRWVGGTLVLKMGVKPPGHLREDGGYQWERIEGFPVVTGVAGRILQLKK